jgi:hypothetical protein
MRNFIDKWSEHRLLWISSLGGQPGLIRGVLNLVLLIFTSERE